MVKFNFKKIFTILLAASIVLMPITLSDCSKVYAEETFYDFSDEAQAEFDKAQRQEARIEINTQPKIEKAKKKSKSVKQEELPKPIIITESNNMISGEVLYVPSGESFNIVLQSTINSASLANDDTIAGILEHDWVYNNKLIAPRGSVVYGRALDTKKAGMFNGDGQMSIMFNEIMLPNGEVIKLTSNVVTLKVESKRALKNAAQIAGGALIGLATGVLWALISGGDFSRGMAVGAGMGAVGGVFSAGGQSGEDVEIQSGTSINVRLTKPMNAVLYKQ